MFGYVEDRATLQPSNKKGSLANALVACLLLFPPSAFASQTPIPSAQESKRQSEAASVAGMASIDSDPDTLACFNDEVRDIVGTIKYRYKQGNFHRTYEHRIKFGYNSPCRLDKNVGDFYVEKLIKLFQAAGYEVALEEQAADLYLKLKW